MALVCIAEFNNPVEASIAKGMLADHGIESVLDGSTILSVLPIPSSLGGVRMMVREEDASEARELLNKHGDQ
ncbi:MAG: DUF2007 domain-containing protein [Muribaculaceae bacterium]|nr:DUF2007 domain-containing protein [Muribaculaceae bacterium]